VAGSVALLVFGIVLGVLAIWDVCGRPTAVRERLEAMPILGASYKRLPSWAFRAFGVWCIALGFGQLIYIYVITHGR